MYKKPTLRNLFNNLQVFDSCDFIAVEFSDATYFIEKSRKDPDYRRCRVSRDKFEELLVGSKRPMVIHECIIDVSNLI